METEQKKGQGREGTRIQSRGSKGIVAEIRDRVSEVAKMAEWPDTMQRKARGGDGWVDDWGGLNVRKRLTGNCNRWPKQLRI